MRSAVPPTCPKDAKTFGRPLERFSRKIPSEDEAGERPAGDSPMPCSRKAFSGTDSFARSSPVTSFPSPTHPQHLHSLPQPSPSPSPPPPPAITTLPAAGLVPGSRHLHVALANSLHILLASVQPSAYRGFTGALPSSDPAVSPDYHSGKRMGSYPYL